MPLTLTELQEYIGQLLSEKRKKKEKEATLEHQAVPSAFSYDEALDFSVPLGPRNLYRLQGINSGWGPVTDGGPIIDDSITRPQETSGFYSFMKESAWARLASLPVISESARAAQDEATFIAEVRGRLAEAQIDEKKLPSGFFRRVYRDLRKNKKVRDPAKLAAWIKDRAKKS
jgi:hypothetical protein